MDSPKNQDLRRSPRSVVRKIVNNFKYNWRFLHQNVGELTKGKVVLGYESTRNRFVPETQEPPKIPTEFGSLSGFLSGQVGKMCLNYAWKHSTIRSRIRGDFRGPNTVSQSVAQRHLYSTVKQLLLNPANYMPLKFDSYRSGTDYRIFLRARRQVVYMTRSLIQNKCCDTSYFRDAIKMIINGSNHARYGLTTLIAPVNKAQPPVMPPYKNCAAYLAIKSVLQKLNYQLPEWFNKIDPSRTLLVNGDGHHTTEILNNWIRNKPRNGMRLNHHLKAISRHFDRLGIILPELVKPPIHDLSRAVFNPDKMPDYIMRDIVGVSTPRPPSKCTRKETKAQYPVFVFAAMHEIMRGLLGTGKYIPPTGITFPGGREKDFDYDPSKPSGEIGTRFVSQSVSMHQCMFNHITSFVKAVFKSSRGCYPSDPTITKYQSYSRYKDALRAVSMQEGDYKRGESSWDIKTKISSLSLQFAFFDRDFINSEYNDSYDRILTYSGSFFLEHIKVFGDKNVLSIFTGLQSGKGDMGLSWAVTNFIITSFVIDKYYVANGFVDKREDIVYYIFGDDIILFFLKQNKVIIPKDVSEFYLKRTGFYYMGVRHIVKDSPEHMPDISFLAHQFDIDGNTIMVPARLAKVMFLSRKHLSMKPPSR